MEWDESDVMAFAVKRSGEKSAKEVEGPALLGDFTVWRCWTCDGKEYHAHHVIAQKGSRELQFARYFPYFASWLTRAFNETDAHERRLDWLRSGIAALTVLALLFLVGWAAMTGNAKQIDYKWLVGALAASSFAYLLGPWTRRRIAR